LDSAVVLGEARNRLFVRIASWMERLCYQNSAKVVVVTKGCYQNALDKGVDPKKIEVVYNGANVEMFRPAKKRNELKRKYGYTGKFVVLYAGNFGLVHGMSTLVETVRLLRSENSIEFLFVGDGPLRGEMLRLREKYRLLNLKILDEVPRKKIIDYLNLADVCLVSAKRTRFSCVLLPVKMFDAWACGRPIILSVDGEAKEHLEIAKAGMAVKPEDSRGIADAIKYLLNNPRLREEYGGNGRRYVEKHFSRKVQAERLEKTLLEVLSKPR
ncbi:unnamed protein product, partial [marine sediment metagenome]